MIRIYDTVIIVLWAWVLLNLFFVPYIGPLLAYGMWEAWDYYCKYRLSKEHG